MALNFPNTPTNAQSYVDPNGHLWVYETVTNSWTAQGAPVAGMVYKGPIDVTTAPPTGATTGSLFTVSTGGTPNVGFVGLPTNVPVGSQVIFDGAKWQLMSTTQPDATEGVKGIVELATAAETTTGTDATRAVHPAGLKVELDKLKLWNRAGTSLVPATAGDSIKGPLVPTNGALGSRNVIINGMVNINQRAVTIAAAAVGAYGPDRWKKVDASNMTQIIEDVNFVPGAKYTLSWKGGTPQVLTAPATGHWTLPNIPITATEIQLELGEVATPFERRSYGQELMLCQRYFNSSSDSFSAAAYGQSTSTVDTGATVVISFPVSMRATPTLVTTESSVGGTGGIRNAYLNKHGFGRELHFAGNATGTCKLTINTYTAAAEL